jgi:ABC-type multidrug transport system fused ATPase/permease subunit
MAFAFMALGAILFVTMSAQTTFMDTATIDMTHAMQRDWFEALLHQDMQYHDIRDSLLHQDMQYHDIRDSMGLFGTWLLYNNVQDSGCDPSDIVDGVDTCDPSSVDILGSLFGIFIATSVLPQVSVATEALTGARFACYPALVAIQRTKKSANGTQKDDQMKD